MNEARASGPGEQEAPRSRRCEHLVRLLFHRLKPESVALFRPTPRGHALRLVASLGREHSGRRRGARMPISGALLAAACEDPKGLWLREISPRARIDLPLHRNVPRSLRLVPFRLRDGTRYLLAVDYLDAPPHDPFDRIETILPLFEPPCGVMPEPLRVRHDLQRVPVQIFCRRLLRPFVDAIPEFTTVRSLGLLLWDQNDGGGEILEVWGTADGDPGRGGAGFRLGSLDFRCALGAPRRQSPVRRARQEGIRYFPVRLGGDIVGNLSLQTDAVREDPGEMEEISRLISWSLERELGMIRRLRDPGAEPDIGNPYQAVVRILDEWSNASRYNEYLSFGFVRFELDSPARLRGPSGRFHAGIRAEIESALRKGDIFLHGSGRDVALIFPRTPPDGAGSALQRLRNLLEGRVIRTNGDGVRVRNADFRVLSYPTDLPTETVLLERCCPPVPPG